MAITNGTNVTALEKPAIGVDTGPGWATAINNSIDAVDGHDHSSNKGVRITPAGVNINSDLDYNENSATELKNVIFNSTVTPATTSYSLYQSSGNLFYRDGSGSAIQMTISGTVNAGAGSITGMTSGNPAVTYADGSKTFNFFTDGENLDFGKMAHADLILYKFSDDNDEDLDYVTIAANAAVSGSSGTIYVPSENGTFLTTATSYAGAIAIATSSGNSNIDLTPHGTGEVNISKVDVNGGTIDGTTVGTSSHTTGKFTTCDATTDFTIGGLVLTDGNIADTGTLALVPVDGCTIALGSDAGDDFNVDGGKLLVEGDTGFCGIGTTTPGAVLHIAHDTPHIVIGGTTDEQITADELLGSVSFYSADPSTTSTGTVAAVRANAEAVFSTSNTPSYLQFLTHSDAACDSSDPLVDSSNLAERMRIDSDGDVTINAGGNLTLGSGAITTSGAIAGGTIDATTDFTIGGTVITNNTITDDGTLTITATTGITLGQDTALAAGKDLETSTTGKIKQKGAFMQSSTHQALTLGY